MPVLNSLCILAGLKLIILLPQLLKSWNYSYIPPCPGADPCRPLLATSVSVSPPKSGLVDLVDLIFLVSLPLLTFSIFSLPLLWDLGLRGEEPTGDLQFRFSLCICLTIGLHTTFNCC